MNEEDFRSRRRQKFLTLKYFLLNQKILNDGFPAYQRGIAKRRARGSFDPVGQGGTCKDKLKLVRLDYTAGQPIESLIPAFQDAVNWLHTWFAANREYMKQISDEFGNDTRLDMSPLSFEDLFEFQIALDLVSLATLFGRGDLVREAVSCMGSERGTDMLFEAVIRPSISEPNSIREFFHEEPYGALVDAIYTAKAPEEASAFVKKYLDGWYKSFEGVPWHDGHTVVTDEYMAYEGYWAFEAAAVCVIHGIDDASFRDHIVYPKDLADWARAHHSLDKVRPTGSHESSADRGRCDAGQPCPRTGFWFTPAQVGSRRHFQAGEVMPVVDPQWGINIWQWDGNQRPNAT